MERSRTYREPQIRAIAPNAFMAKPPMRSFIVELQVETAEVEVRARTPEQAVKKAHDQVFKAGILSVPGADGTRILEEHDSKAVIAALFPSKRSRKARSTERA